MYQYCLKICSIYGEKYGAELFFTYLYKTDNFIYLKEILKYDKAIKMITDLKSIETLMECEIHLEQLCSYLKVFLSNNANIARNKDVDRYVENRDATRLINNLCDIRNNHDSLINISNLELFKEELIEITSNVAVIIETFSISKSGKQIKTNIVDSMDFLSKDINYNEMKGNYFIVNE